MTTYRIHLPDPQLARGADPRLSFQAVGAEAFAEELQAALRDDSLFQRWRSAQPDPDEVDPGLGVLDPAASVSGHQREKRAELTVVTSIPGEVLRHRMRLLAGSHWELRNVH